MSDTVFPPDTMAVLEGITETLHEHWLVRRAKTDTLSAVFTLQNMLNHYFIGGIQQIGENPKSYTMDAVAEMVEAYNAASKIATEREDAARAARKAEKEAQQP